MEEQLWGWVEIDNDLPVAEMSDNVQCVIHDSENTGNERNGGDEEKEPTDRTKKQQDGSAIPIRRTLEEFGGGQRRIPTSVQYGKNLLTISR